MPNFIQVKNKCTGLFPKYQEFYLILKSVVLIEDLDYVISNDDIFDFEQDENDMYILFHSSSKFDEKRPILAFDESIKNMNMKKLHKLTYQCIHQAWVEYAI